MARSAAVDLSSLPDDLRTALAAWPRAMANFAAFPPAARRDALEWIAAARRPSTRAKRIADTARLAESNYRATPWKRPGRS